MSIIDQFVWVLESDSSALKRDIEDSKKKVDSLGSSFNQAEQAGVTSASNIGIGFGKLLGVLASVASVAKLFNMASDFAESTKSLKNLSDQTGIAIEDMDGLQKGLQRVGVDSENTARAVTEITNAIGSESKALADYGIAAKDAAGNSRDTLDVLGDIAEQASKMSAQDASSFFKSLRITDPQLINNLRKGRSELENLIRAEKIKGVADKEQLKLAQEYEEASNNLNITLGDIADTISSQVLPIYTKLKTAFNDSLEFLSKHSNFLKVFAGVLTTVAVPALLLFASAQLKAVAIPALIVGGILLLSAAIEDLIGYFNGHNSAIGELAKKHEWLADALNIVKDVIEGAQLIWEDLMDAWESAVPVVHEVMDSIGSTFKAGFDWISNLIKEWAEKAQKFIEPIAALIGGIFSGAKTLGGVIGGLFNSSPSTEAATAAEVLNEARVAPTNNISHSSIQNSKNSSQTNNNNQTNNITINTTADPKAIADKVKTTTKDGLSEFARQNRGGSLN